MSETLQSRIAAQVEAFAQDIVAVLQRSVVQAVSASLGADGAGQPTPRTRRTSSSVRKKAPRKAAAPPVAPGRGKRSPKEIARLTDRLLREIKRKGGQRIEEIGKTLSVSPKELALPTRKLIADRKIKATGQRRATRYNSR